MTIIYNIIFILFAIIYIPIFLFKGRKREGVGLRLGIYPDALKRSLSAKKNIWVHAVSVGEVLASSPILEKLRDRYPEHRLVITTVTETGNLVAKKVANSDDIVLFLPFDVSFIVKKVISYINPTALIILETEIWPNLIIQSAKMNIPIFIVNGRISDDSFGRYLLIRPILKGILSSVKIFLMQSDVDRERIIALGAEAERVFTAGNIKFDKTEDIVISKEKKSDLRLSLKLSETDKLFVAGSTHPKEEAIIFSSYQELKKRYNNLKLLIAPRHPERADEICGLAFQYGFDSVRVSQLSAVSSQHSASHVYILDTVGQLRGFYSIADAVFIGGSLIKKGGQNMIEPALFAKPILFGPHTYNFRDITRLFMDKEAAILVKDKTGLVKSVSDILEDPESANRLGALAREIIDSNSGASDRMVEVIYEKISL